MKYLLSLTILLLATQAHADRCKVYKHKIDTFMHKMPAKTPIRVWNISWSSDKRYDQKTYNYCHTKMEDMLEKHILDNYELPLGVECNADVDLHQKGSYPKWEWDYIINTHRREHLNPKYRYKVHCKQKVAPRVIPTPPDDLGR